MRKSDRIGIVAFSGEALTQVPLTTDYPVVQSAINNLQPGQLEVLRRVEREDRLQYAEDGHEYAAPDDDP